MDSNAPSFREKENMLISAIKKDNGAPVFESAEEGFDFLETHLRKIPDYVAAAGEYERKMPILTARYEGARLREAVDEIDGRRRAAHDAAIAAIDIINRAYARFGLPPFADIDTTDRRAVAEFCGRYVGNVFGEAVGGH